MLIERIKSMADWPPTQQEALDKVDEIISGADQKSMEDNKKAKKLVKEKYLNNKKITKPCRNQNFKIRKQWFSESKSEKVDCFLDKESCLSLHWDALLFSQVGIEKRKDNSSIGLSVLTLAEDYPLINENEVLVTKMSGDNISVHFMNHH